MDKTIFTIKEDRTESFRLTLREIVTYLTNTFGISQTALSKEILHMNESSLRSLLEVSRGKGIKRSTLCKCYILYMLKEGNLKEDYLLFFKGERAKSIIDEIDIAGFKKKLKDFSLSNETSSSKENTITHETISPTSDETNVSEIINEEHSTIINNFIDFLKSLPIQYYELSVQNKKFGEYFIINYVYDTKKKPETIVAIALNQEINNIEKSKTSSTRKKELEIIEETLDTADIFWFFHYKKTTQKQFDNYIHVIPGLISKTLIEAIDNYEKIRIIYRGSKTKLGKILTDTDNIKKCNYKVDWLSTFTVPTSE